MICGYDKNRLKYSNFEIKFYILEHNIEHDSLSLIGPWMPDKNSGPSDFSLAHAAYFVPMPYSSLNRHRPCYHFQVLKVTKILWDHNSISCHLRNVNF